MPSYQHTCLSLSSWDYLCLVLPFFRLTWLQNSAAFFWLWRRVKGGIFANVHFGKPQTCESFYSAFAPPPTQVWGMIYCQNRAGTGFTLQLPSAWWPSSELHCAAPRDAKTCSYFMGILTVNECKLFGLLRRKKLLKSRVFQMSCQISRVPTFWLTLKNECIA